MKKITLTCISLFLPLVLAIASESNVVNYKDENLAKEIFSELKCMACEGQSILESEARFAKAIKSFVREEIAAGKTKISILDSLRIKYGEAIMFKPPLKNSTIALWVLPFLFLAIGSFLAVSGIREHKMSKS